MISRREIFRLCVIRMKIGYMERERIPLRVLISRSWISYRVRLDLFIIGILNTYRYLSISRHSRMLSMKLLIYSTIKKRNINI